jgi:hypothetical protein
MRIVLASVFAFGLLIALEVPAGAATAHRHRTLQESHQEIIVRPNLERFGHDEAVPPGWYKFPGYPPIPPEQNRNLDPSNYGGG